MELAKIIMYLPDIYGFHGLFHPYIFQDGASTINLTLHN